MARFHGYATALMGLFIILVPHHILPTGTTTTITGAVLKEFCYSWSYHPELFLGISVFLMGCMELRGRHGMGFEVMVLGLILIFSAYMMMPPEYYLKIGADMAGYDYNPTIWAGQNSIRAHIGIRPLVFILGVLVSVVGYASQKGWEPTMGPGFRFTTSYIVLQNMRGRPFRSITVVLMVAVAASTLFSGTMLIVGSKNGLENLVGRMGADIVIVPQGSAFTAQEILLDSGFEPVYMDAEILDRVIDIYGVKEASPQLFAGTFQYYRGDVPFQAGVVGIDPERDFTVRPWLLTSDVGEMGSMDAIAGRGVKYTRGHTITFAGMGFNVIGTLKVTGSTYFDETVFVPITDAWTLPGVPSGSISAINVKVDQGTEPELVAESIEDIPGVSAVPVRRATTLVRDRLEGLARIFSGLVLSMWALAVSGVYIIFSMTANERKREIGVIRAIGAQRGYIYGLYLKEAMLLGLFGGGVGTLAGVFLIIIFKNAVIGGLGLPFTWPGDVFIVFLSLSTVVLSSVVGIIGAGISIKRNVDTDPYELIRAGDS